MSNNFTESAFQTPYTLREPPRRTPPEAVVIVVLGRRLPRRRLSAQPPREVHLYPRRRALMQRLHGRLSGASSGPRTAW